jgi:hypothetical protein
MQSVNRGYSPDDKRDFTGPSLAALKRSAEDLLFLLDRGYPIGPAATFVGNHYLLSERQRTALKRSVSAEADASARKAKQKQPEDMAGETVNIDGFNVIITLEVAQSGSPVLLCMDGAYRDLAGLRGTYRLIDKTDIAIRSIIGELKKLSAARAVFWLDSPVSNSGRLKVRIAEIAEEESFDAGIEMVNSADAALYSLDNVISSDSVILDRCPSWFNLGERMIPGIPGVWIVDITK